VSTAESTIILTLDMQTQRRLVEQVRAVIKAAPLVRPLAIGGQPMSVRITNAGDFGWVGDGISYHYSDKDSRGFPWPRIPGEWIEIADQAVAADPRHDGSPTRWDAAIIKTSRIRSSRSRLVTVPRGALRLRSDGLTNSDAR
jgi:alkylated DNA repair protein (DNA oxidative demethylase)